MSTSTSEELRCSTRIGVRTPVVLYEKLKTGGLRRSRAWTDDLSMVGARIVTEKPLESKELFLRIMLPDLKDQLIQCQVVREHQQVVHSLRNSRLDLERSCYGVQFLGLADQSVLDTIEAADNLALGR
ncbi:MAG: PilZ domain-containing protein [Pirellulaceae bacterium]|nr:PilZ domain-containing protein [Pirellulaceae bacterium]